MRLQLLPDGELIAHAVLVIDLISYAYDVPSSNPSPRLNSLPDWIYGDRYDIEAEASPYAITTSRFWVEVSGTSKERGVVGFTDLGGLLLNQLLTV
jgi:hypothetical protein